MSVGARLKDERGAHLVTRPDEDECSVLVTAAEPRHRLGFWQQRFLRTDDGSWDMAINASSGGGSSLIVWNGTGAGDTGGDWTQSDDYGNSAETAGSARSGTNGLDSGDWDDKDRIIFDNGSEIDISSYESISFWVQRKAGGPDVRVEWRDNGDRVGDRVDMQNYSSLDLDIWKNVTIPLADFNLDGDVRYLRFESRVDNQEYWFDDIELLIAGGAAVGPKIFRVEVPAGDLADIHEIVFVVVAPTSDWTWNEFANITALTNGVIVRHYDWHAADVKWQFLIDSNAELLGRLRMDNKADFLNSSVMLRLVLDLRMWSARIRKTDVLDVLIRDNLSSLTLFEAWAIGGKRIGQL